MMMVISKWLEIGETMLLFVLILYLAYPVHGTPQFGVAATASKVPKYLTLSPQKNCLGNDDWNNQRSKDDSFKDLVQASGSTCWRSSWIWKQERESVIVEAGPNSTLAGDNLKKTNGAPKSTVRTVGVSVNDPKTSDVHPGVCHTGQSHDLMVL
jgi:hypothetical protein